MVVSKNSSGKKETIISVTEKDLCTGCGTCVAICPREAIELTLNNEKGMYIPELNKELCNNCGTCLKVCPGLEIDFDELRKEIFNNDPDDSIFDNYIDFYIGHAKDFDIQYNSASGGLITAILIFALERRIIDGALVTRMNKDRPLEPEPFIARTKEEIIEASKSKYCPVPANIALKEILNSNKNEKFAVVGLPCHINAIRKAEQINFKLRDKIALHFAIMCSHADNFLAIKFILNCFGIKTENVKSIEYRGRGWPGSMLVNLNDGTQRIIPYKDYIKAHELWMFNPTCCNFCCDSLGSLSDISFGDAWRIENVSENKNGVSLCISRTLLGDKLIHEAVSMDSIKAEKIDRGSIIGLQGITSSSRTRYSKVNMIFNKNHPKYNMKSLEDDSFNPKSFDYAKYVLLSINRRVLSKEQIWKTSRIVLNIEEMILRRTLLR